MISKSSIKIKASATRIWEILVTPEIAKSYFFGAEIETDWKVGSPITFTGEYNGNKYQEKGILLCVVPNTQLQYSHWSNFDGLPDEPENYRTWTFDLEEMNGMSQLSISEDNIPTEKQKNRSDEFWAEVLLKIKHLAEA
ncbi:SRPBCC family protein [Chondrinema litorale]|uniref:SRPBCC family protein n=1 Tax=Chondrinema litorale TaxID=2994555 RepID=UPI00254346E4|nr:SRPBCC domain-containing protein [Chondrinema litorale]UZR99718.1 SRPBCC domain-containing protein [Chondrinema litorale]